MSGQGISCSLFSAQIHVVGLHITERAICIIHEKIDVKAVALIGLIFSCDSNAAVSKLRCNRVELFIRLRAVLSNRCLFSIINRKRRLRQVNTMRCLIISVC